MTYKESLDKEVSTAVSNIIGFTSAYILFYLLFGIPINFTVLCLIPCMFLLSFFVSGYLFYRNPRLKRRTFKNEIRDTIRIILFSSFFIWFFPSGVEPFNTPFLATALVLALLLKGLFIRNEWFA